MGDGATASILCDRGAVSKIIETAARGVYSSSVTLSKNE